MAKILILEDDYHLAKGWRETLKTHGHDATLCFTSSEAISQAENDHFDLFIIDMKIEINVRDMKDSGVRFLAYLQRIIPKSEIERRVIGVSGLLINSDHRPTRHAFEMFDVKLFLPKPIDPAVLVALIEQQATQIME